MTILAILICAIFAWAFGRRIILWSLLGYFFGFWALIALFLLPKKPVKLPRFPKFLLDWYGARFVDKTIAKMEKQF